MANSAFRAAAAAVLGVAVYVSAAMTSASAATITFDDVNPAAQAAIPNGYSGLDWDNFSTIDPAAAGVTPSTSGYFKSITSGKYSAFNIDGDPAAISSVGTFNLISGNFTAAWSNGLQLTITGYNGASILHTLTVGLTTTSPLSEVLNWIGLTKVTFSTAGGTDIEGQNPIRTQFAVDDLKVVAATPIPGSLLLLLTGCGAIGALGFKRRRSATRAEAA